MRSPRPTRPTAPRSAILLIHCPDRKGIVAAVTDFLYRHEGNILHLDQHVDAEKQVFFMRVEWDLARFTLGPDDIAARLARTIGRRFRMTFRLHFSGEVTRIAVFVTRLPHCLYDILARCQSGEWRAQVPVVVGNHPELASVAGQFGVEFHLFPITKQNRLAQERRQLQLLERLRIDLVVLARYMQVLGRGFVSRYEGRIINIHHSFLPAFPGARPYHSAYERGVKIIGATSHYVTSDLDAGPIIEQDVVRVSHKDGVPDLVRKGRDLEQLVLSRAVWAHLERKVLAYDNRTVVFL
jgi:formyltetrahydrofolate deformylase